MLKVIKLSFVVISVNQAIVHPQKQCQKPVICETTLKISASMRFDQVINWTQESEYRPRECTLCLTNQVPQLLNYFVI